MQLSSRRLREVSGLSIALAIWALGFSPTWSQTPASARTLDQQERLNEAYDLCESVFKTDSTVDAAEATTEKAWTAFKEAGDEASGLRCAQRFSDSLLEQGYHDRAIELQRRIVSGFRKIHPAPSNFDHVFPTYRLGEMLTLSAEFSEAETHLRNALRDFQKVLEPNHHFILVATSRLGELYQKWGRIDAAEDLIGRAYEGAQSAYEPGMENRTNIELLMARVHRDRGRFTKAEPLLRGALEEAEKLGGDHPLVLSRASDLAELYQEQGRLYEAEILQRRVLQTHHRISGANDATTHDAALFLGKLLIEQGRIEESEGLVVPAHTFLVQEFGEDSIDNLYAMAVFANLRQKQGRHAEAEVVQRKVQGLLERTYGRSHPDTLDATLALAEVVLEQGRGPDAEPLARHVLAANQENFGATDYRTLKAARLLTRVRLATVQRRADALTPARVLVAGRRRHLGAAGNDPEATAQRARDQKSSALDFVLAADAVFFSSPQAHGDVPARDEALRLLQESMSSQADVSVAEQVARRRVATQNPQLALALNERQQLTDQWRRLDEDLANGFSLSPQAVMPNLPRIKNEGYAQSYIPSEVAAMVKDSPTDAPQRETGVREKLQTVIARIDDIDAQLNREASSYFALIRPDAVTRENAQESLSADEAILLVAPGPHGTHVMAITRDTIEWHRSDIDLHDVGRSVGQLRADVGSANTPADRGLARTDVTGRPAFSRTIAYQLHQKLIGPVALALEGKRRLLVAASGPLAGLPFSLLVTEAPTGEDHDPQALRETHWLGDKFAIAHIPSVQSLVLLRREQKAIGVPSGFLGIGDPLLKGSPAPRSPRSGALLEVSKVHRPGRTRDGALSADVSALRNMPRLPGTAIELEAVRRALSASPDALLMQAAATEPNIRRVDWAKAGVIIFSTHGLTADEASGIGEGGLVLTPPDDQAENSLDDGYLSASEVASLQLNADWVILSACNTATGDEENPGLGQLARAFFFAGARNLLGSHWPVSDDVAPTMIPRVLELQKTGGGRAEALQQAMREVRESGRPEWAHPFFWAPFVLIGGGA